MVIIIKRAETRMKLGLILQIMLLLFEEEKKGVSFVIIIKKFYEKVIN